MKDNRNCGDCAYWARITDSTKLGRCMHGPPSIGNESDFGTFPMMFSTQMCGRFNRTISAAMASLLAEDLIGEDK